MVGTIMCDIGTIKVRFYLLEGLYLHGYCRITPHHICCLKPIWMHNLHLKSQYWHLIHHTRKKKANTYKVPRLTQIVTSHCRPFITRGNSSPSITIGNNLTKVKETKRPSILRGSHISWVVQFKNHRHLSSLKASFEIELGPLDLIWY
jgi:hypothetical protein